MGKYGLNERNDIKFIQNKMGEKKSQNIRNRKWWTKCNGKVESNGKINRQRGMRKVRESISVGVKK